MRHTDTEIEEQDRALYSVNQDVVYNLYGERGSNLIDHVFGGKHLPTKTETIIPKYDDGDEVTDGKQLCQISTCRCTIDE